MAPEPVCDECGEKFEVKVEKEKLKDGGVGIYFKCPHCGAKYKVNKMSKKAIRMVKELKKLSKKFKDIDVNKNREGELSPEEKKYNKKLKEYQQEIESTYSEKEVVGNE